MNESLKNNGIGLGQTVKLQIANWGFDVYDLDKEIHLWHSPKDSEIVFNAVEKMVKKMPNATLHIQQKNTHEPSDQTLIEVFDMIQNKQS